MRNPKVYDFHTTCTEDYEKIFLKCEKARRSYLNEEGEEEVSALSL